MPCAVGLGSRVDTLPRRALAIGASAGKSKPKEIAQLNVDLRASRLVNALEEIPRAAPRSFRGLTFSSSQRAFRCREMKILVSVEAWAFACAFCRPSLWQGPRCSLINTGASAAGSALGPSSSPPASRAMALRNLLVDGREGPDHQPFGASSSNSTSMLGYSQRSFVSATGSTTRISSLGTGAVEGASRSAEGQGRSSGMTGSATSHAVGTSTPYVVSALTARLRLTEASKQPCASVSAAARASAAPDDGRRPCSRECDDAASISLSLPELS